MRVRRPSRVLLLTASLDRVDRQYKAKVRERLYLRTSEETSVQGLNDVGIA